MVRRKVAVVSLPAIKFDDVHAGNALFVFLLLMNLILYLTPCCQGKAGHTMTDWTSPCPWQLGTVTESPGC